MNRLMVHKINCAADALDKYITARIALLALFRSTWSLLR